MLEILQFVFSSFWVWLGSAIMLYSVVIGSALLLSVIFGGEQLKRKRNINTTCINVPQNISPENLRDRMKKDAERYAEIIRSNVEGNVKP